MSPHRYRRVDDHSDDEGNDPVVNNHTETTNATPSSPPPSFHSRSRSASPSSRLIFSQDPLDADADADRTLADTFGDDGEDSDGDGEIDERQRFMRGSPSDVTPSSTSPIRTDSSRQPHSQSQNNGQRSGGILQRTFTSLPAFAPSASATSRLIHDSHDGVFANMAAKPERGEKTEDLPPTYEQAAADATPPYWETTIVAPGMSSDEVYVDGLPVGSFFSFIWNGMISASFQFVGFFLTYLLHTTHAAKNGSRAGLGLTLIQYGFYMRGGSSGSSGGGGSGGSGSGTGGADDYVSPPDPNSHDFNPESVHDSSYQSGASSSSQSGGLFADMTTSEWISYILMIVGWFILIRALSDYLRARRHEQLVLHSPERGLPVPVIAEGERSESVV